MSLREDHIVIMVGVVVLIALMLVLVSIGQRRGWGVSSTPAILTRHHAVESMTGIMALALVVVGVSLFVAPGPYLRSPTFDVAMDGANGPTAWGVIMCMAGLWLAGALAFRDSFGLTITSITSCAVWTVWAAAISYSSTTGLGVPGTSMAFVALSLINALAAFIYAREYVDQVEERSQEDREKARRRTVAMQPGNQSFTPEDRKSIAARDDRAGGV